MKSILFVIFFFSCHAFSQKAPSKDSIVSILFVSQYQCIDLPVIDLIKGCRDVGLIVNIEDADVFIVVNGYFKYTGKIVRFEYDSIGHLNIEFNIYHKRNVGKVNMAGELFYTYGEDFFIMRIKNKKRKYTKIKCEFHKEQFF
jgi:hypothetical protein